MKDLKTAELSSFNRFEAICGIKLHKYVSVTWIKDDYRNVLGIQFTVRRSWDDPNTKRFRVMAKDDVIHGDRLDAKLKEATDYANELKSLQEEKDKESARLAKASANVAKRMVQLGWEPDPIFPEMKVKKDWFDRGSCSVNIEAEDIDLEIKLHSLTPEQATDVWTKIKEVLTA